MLATYFYRLEAISLPTNPLCKHYLFVPAHAPSRAHLATKHAVNTSLYALGFHHESQGFVARWALLGALFS